MPPNWNKKQKGNNHGVSDTKVNYLKLNELTIRSANSILSRNLMFKLRYRFVQRITASFRKTTPVHFKLFVYLYWTAVVVVYLIIIALNLIS